MKRNVTVFTGLQYADEDKRKIAKFKYQNADIVVHTTLLNNKSFKVSLNDGNESLIKLVPESILCNNITTVIGPENIINLQELIFEFAELKKAGIQVSPDNLKISDRVKITISYNSKVLNTANECDIIMHDLFNTEKLKGEISRIVHSYKFFDGKGSACNIISDLVKEYTAIYEHLKEYVCDVSYYVNEQIKKDKKVIVQGPQVFSDIGNKLSSVGISEANVKEVIGIMKAYTSTNSAENLPTIMDEECAQKLENIESEIDCSYGSKKYGYLDLAFIRYACLTNKIDNICINNIDVIGKVLNHNMRVCCAYGYKDKFINYVPYDLEECEPIYLPISYGGWDISNTKISEYSDLPESCKKFVAIVEFFLEVPVKYISFSNSDKVIIKN